MIHLLFTRHQTCTGLLGDKNGGDSTPSIYEGFTVFCNFVQCLVLQEQAFDMIYVVVKLGVSLK